MNDLLLENSDKILEQLISVSDLFNDFNSNFDIVLNYLFMIKVFVSVFVVISLINFIFLRTSFFRGEN